MANLCICLVGALPYTWYTCLIPSFSLCLVEVLHPAQKIFNSTASRCHRSNEKREKKLYNATPGSELRRESEMEEKKREDIK